MKLKEKKYFCHMKGLQLQEKDRIVSSFREENKENWDGTKSREHCSPTQIYRNVSWKPVFLFLLVKAEFHING